MCDLDSTKSLRGNRGHRVRPRRSRHSGSANVHVRAHHRLIHVDGLAAAAAAAATAVLADVRVVDSPAAAASNIFGCCSGGRGGGGGSREEHAFHGSVSRARETKDVRELVLQLLRLWIEY